MQCLDLPQVSAIAAGPPPPAGTRPEKPTQLMIDLNMCSVYVKTLLDKHPSVRNSAHRLYRRKRPQS